MIWKYIVLVRIVLKTRIGLGRLVQYRFSIQYRLVQYISILYIPLYNNLLLVNEARHVRISDNDIFSGVNMKIIYRKTFLLIYVVCDSTDNLCKNLLKLYYCRKPSVYKLIWLLLLAMIKNYAIYRHKFIFRR